jgi:hypothetical protein
MTLLCLLTAVNVTALIELSELSRLVSFRANHETLLAITNLVGLRNAWGAYIRYRGMIQHHSCLI